ncbi:MAG: histidine kinase [Acidobacteriia bacterium]|nr:histidine kinase [Terriglobia bacterium]
MADQRRGSLKIYMGYAAGVGKTYQMLEEAQELRARGLDVVVGYFEPHARKDTIAKTDGLELIPRKQIEYRGSVFEEMDTDAILARNPAICAVDEFPHTNVPGSQRAKRWEDVQILLDAGISVITTMNIQHLESLNDQVRHITGVRVRETIPDWVVQQAGEVVMVDLTPRALLHRLARGVIYSREKAEQAMNNFFRESTLVALRELALRETAHEVVQRSATAVLPPRPGENALLSNVRHKLLILVTPSSSSAMVIRRARRVADFLGAECFAVTVQPSGDLKELPAADRESVERHLNFARNLHIETRILEGAEVATALVNFARRNQITQIFLARPRGNRWSLPLFSRDLVQRIVNIARDMQIVIVAERQPVDHA